MMKPLKLSGGMLNRLNLETNDCPFPTCKFTQLELSSCHCRIPQSLYTVSRVRGVKAQAQFLYAA